MSFGARVKQYREAKGYTQEQLAGLIGVAKTTITGYERGNRAPDVDKIKKLAAALGVTGDDLLDTGISPQKSPLISSEALQIAQDFDRLDNYGKKLLQDIIAHELERLDMPPTFHVKVFPYSVRNLVGKSELLGEVPEPVFIEHNEWTEKVSFGLRLREIIQNAYEAHPRAYERGDILFVEDRDDLKIGDWGLFYVDNFCCVLEYGEIQMLDRLGNCGNITIEDCDCIGRIADVKLRADGKLEKRRPIKIY